MKRFFSILFVSLLLVCHLVPANAQETAATSVTPVAAPIAPVNPSAPAESSKLNLSQRRAVSDFMANKLPDLLKQLREAVGFDVDVTMDWEVICNPDYVDSIADFWTRQYFVPMTDAMKDLGKDAMGKTALKAKLKRIHFTNTADIYNKSKAPSFAEGTLSYDHTPSSNVPEGKDDSNYKEAVEAIVTLMEKNL